MICSSSSCGRSGLSIIAIDASTSSRKLCGGMLVAIPTAMPDDPFMSKLGIRPGSTVGSFLLPSKFG